MVEKMKFVGRALMILPEHLLRGPETPASCAEVSHPCSFIPLNLERPQISNFAYLKFMNRSNALQEPNLKPHIF